jgi:protein SCO1/2
LFTRVSAIAACVLVVLGLGVSAFLVMQRANADPFADCRRGAVAGGAASIGGPFKLETAAGTEVTEADVIRGPTLVYFGYSFCPDICPTDLSRNSIATADLADQGVKIEQVFVSIDPDRDTPEVVGDFTKQIDPAIIGLTGTPDEIAAAAKAYKVFYRKAGDDPPNYLMDHSTVTSPVAPKTGFLEFYTSDTSPEDVASSVSCFARKL